MLDIKLIRENPELIQKAAKDKKVDVDINHLLEIDKKKTELQKSMQMLQEERNSFTKSIAGKPTDDQIQKGKDLRENLEKEERAFNAVKEELDLWLLKIPNPAKSDVKFGKDESENEVIRKFKEPTKFDFVPKDHLELGEALDIIDVERAAKVSGARFAYLKNDGVLMEFALVQFALEVLTKEGFSPIIPPTLIKRETMQGLGYMENGGEEDMFSLANDDMFLVGTAEHSLVPMHMNETLSVKDLPKRYAGFSSAFRREAGSYGKDTKGILRVHQFDKVEMVSFVEKSEDDKELAYLLSLEEKLFQALAIPYQVIQMCTGDLGFPAAKKFDIEAWLPSQNKYREVTSVSTVTDFQSRRLKIRYRKEDVTEFAYVLNGTVFAIGRTLIAILENYQQEDGTVKVPEVLQKYMGKDVIKLLSAKKAS
jgi:seryl-tRNA synthetase